MYAVPQPETYSGETFDSLVLSQQTVQGRQYEDCEFRKCSFVEVRLDGCKFIDCRFIECRLIAVKPANSRFTGVKFVDSQVVGMDWTLAEAIEELEFTGCKVNYSNFKLLAIPGTRIEKCEAKEVAFIETDLSQGVFTGTDFENSRFFKTNLAGADFRGAKNYAISAYHNNLKGAKFSLPEAMNLLYGLEITLE